MADTILIMAGEVRVDAAGKVHKGETVIPMTTDAFLDHLKKLIEEASK